MLSSTTIYLLFIHDALYEVLNDPNEKMLDHNVCKEMVLHQYVF